MQSGRGHFKLSRRERESLSLLMRWMMANKQSAAFSPIWGSMGSEGEYGIWRWQSARAELSWTGQPRGILVEFKRKDDGLTYGFVWNNILREFNDASLPKRMGRGYFQYVLGISTPKSETDTWHQNMRVSWKMVRRQCNRLVQHLTSDCRHTGKAL